MTTQLSPVFRSRSLRSVGAGAFHTPGELVALHAHLARRLRSMVTEHRPGCAFVAPYPSNQDLSPSEILVIPFRSEAAMFSVAFQPCERTVMMIRIGEYGVWECLEGDRPTPSLAATAEHLFEVALSGRYRENVWTHTVTGRCEGGQGYFMDDSQDWQDLSPRGKPAPPQSFWHWLSVQDRRFEPY